MHCCFSFSPGDLINNTLRGLSLVYTQEIKGPTHNWNKPVDQYLAINVRYLNCYCLGTGRTLLRVHFLYIRSFEFMRMGLRMRVAHGGLCLRVQERPAL